MKRNAAAMVLFTAGLGACAPIEAQTSNGGTESAIGICDAAAAQSFVGQMAHADVIVQARQASGAATARTIAPGQMVTQEFDGTRLTLDTDADNRITTVRCG